MLPQRLKEARTEKGVTQEEVAGFLGFSRPTYTAYESGRRKPDQDTLVKIAQYLNVSTDYLLGLTNIKTPAQTIAAHHDGEDWTEEELEDIENFKEFVKMRREQKKNQ